MWHRQNPLPESLRGGSRAGFRFAGRGRPARTKAKPGSVFSLLKVDPLAGMDPAVREIAQTRMFAERALFVTQKMPMLLRWQTELLSVNAVEMPAVQQLVTNSTQISASVERFAVWPKNCRAGQHGARGNPQGAPVAGKEPDAAGQRGAPDPHGGNPMSTSLNTTLTTLDAVMKRFGVGETNNAGAAEHQRRAIPHPGLRADGGATRRRRRGS